MPQIIPNGYAVLQFIHTVDGSSELAMATLGIATPDPFTATLVEVAGDIYRDSILTELASNVTLITVRGVVGAGVLAEVAYADNGGAAVDPCPPQVSYLINKITGVPGRQNKGRMYLPGVRENQVDGGGQISGGQITGINGALDNLYADLVAAFMDPVVLHSSVGDTPTTITALRCSSLVGTQRGRLR